MNFEQAKLEKLLQLKVNLNSEMELVSPRKDSFDSYIINGVFRSFKVKISDLPTLTSRIDRLRKAIVGTTAQWTDVEGNRLDLNLEQFECLRNHLDVRDQALHTIYQEIKSEIKACKTLEELKAIDINFV